MENLGYEVIIPKHEESGRSWLSKGLLRKAKTIANRNIELLAPLISEETPLIGIEPSAILTFRDEYIDLADDANFEKAKQLAKNVLMIDEFIAREIDTRKNQQRNIYKGKKRNKTTWPLPAEGIVFRCFFCKNFIFS